MKVEKFSLLNRLKSFKHAFNGLRILLREEHNSRVHFAISGLVIALGVLLKISFIEWGVIVFSIGFVFSVEILNSSIENLIDFVSLEKHDAIKKIKDLSAAAVLVSSITAIIIGTLVFLPKIIALF